MELRETSREKLITLIGKTGYSSITLNLLSTRWNRLSETSLTLPRILSWLKHSFRKKTRNQNSKENDQVLCTTILYRLPRLWNVLNQSETVPSILNEMSEIIQPRDSSYDHAPFVEEIFEVAEGPLVTSNRHLLQTLEKQKKLHSNYGRWNRNLKAVLKW